MSRKKPEWLEENVPKLLEYCEKEGFTVVKINMYQYRVAGATSLVDVWPSRMKVHIIASEKPLFVNDYRQLSSRFNEEELDRILN